MKTIHVVAALIADPSDSSRFLVQQRFPHAARANLWEFPGGKVEAGETEEAALVRECREELAVELRVGRKLWTTVHEYSDLTVKLDLFGADIQAGQPQPLGAQAIRFCTVQQMKELPFCEADLPLIDSFVAGTVFTR